MKKTFYYKTKNNLNGGTALIEQVGKGNTEGECFIDSYETVVKRFTRHVLTCIPKHEYDGLLAKSKIKK